MNHTENQISFDMSKFVLQPNEITKGTHLTHLFQYTNSFQNYINRCSINLIFEVN